MLPKYPAYWKACWPWSAMHVIRAGAEQPLLNVRVQLWMRELRRMVVSTGDDARWVWADDLRDANHTIDADPAPKYLPLVVCRNCGAAGWLTRKRHNDEQLDANLKNIYRAFFKQSPEVCIVYPDGTSELHAKADFLLHACCLRCLVLNAEDASACWKCDHGSRLLRVRVPHLARTQDGKSKSKIVCTYCRAVRSISIAGVQAASLTAVLIGQLFGSRYNRDKKVLTFSDSVQDASHRAGFFQARTYQFTVRTSLLQHIAQDGEGARLSDLAHSYVDAQQSVLGDRDFVGTFIAPNLCWRAAYQDLLLCHQLPNDSKLVDLVRKRLHWEVHQAFGLHARLGRNLENTVSATAHIRRDLLAQVEDPLLQRLRNEFGELRALPLPWLRQFLVGFLYHVRTRGGIDHTALQGYVKHRGNRYLMSERHIAYMPRVGKFSPTPAFVTNGRIEAFLPIGSGRSNTWLKSWATKTLFRDIGMALYVPKVYEYVLHELVKAAVMKRYDVGKNFAWGLRADALQITTKVFSSRCDQCSFQVSFPVTESHLWQNMPCLRFACSGTLHVVDTNHMDYYRMRYRSSDLRRFVAAEHTGLLERAKREAVEQGFMRSNPFPWDPNIISCTPTLELGIDIGDLSSVVLCSMPPTQANYVQRIGRAGRRDGNALALTLAVGRPHDLYFYQEPEDMIAGRVQVPGTFLRAPAVLERQLAAFTFDSWVSSGINEKAVPHQLGSVLGQLEQRDPHTFPYNWLAFIERNADDLYNQFITLFGDDLGEMLKDRLQSIVRPCGSSRSILEDRVLHALNAKQNERQRLNKHIKQIWRQLNKLKASPQDEDRMQQERGLHRGRRTFAAAKTAINRKPVFGFLCDAGILPNYAFPQSTATLRSIILQSEEDAVPDAWTEEYVRPGIRAIREFAPHNTFYAGGRRVEVEQLDLDVSSMEQWRMCDRCAYGERISPDVAAQCPQCSSEVWLDSGRVHHMVRMRQVGSVSDDRYSRSHDEAEERDRSFFVVRTLVQFCRDDVTCAYTCSEAVVPFGFEFVRKATFREINFGEKEPGSEPLLIAGEEQDAHGFACCPKCGRVRAHNIINHSYSCSERSKGTDVCRNTFLYHEFESEAIRMLLPIVSDGTQTNAIDSFCAALNMGLRDHFRGQVDHLKTVAQDEPIPGQAERRTFVFLYDSVPGGTGYLSDLLSDPNTILQVLRIAVERMEQCACAEDEAKDGCYRCLFAFRNSRVRDRVSRSVALRVLRMILEEGGALTKVKGLDQVDMDSLLESECERRLIALLEERAAAARDASFSVTSAGVPSNYLLKIGERTWTIDSQVSLGNQADVVIASRPDFIFRPDHQAKALPIAVFADGFRHHRNKLGDDTAKRMAIIASGRYHVWSLSWDDITAESTSVHYEDYLSLDPTKRPNARHFTQFLGTFEANIGDLSRVRQVRCAGSMDLLMQFLREPNAAKWGALAYCHAVVCITADENQDWFKTAQQMVPRWFELDGDSSADRLMGRYSQTTDGDLHCATIMVRTTKRGLRAFDVHALRLAAHLDDTAPDYKEFKRAWNGFLRFMNLIQFLPKCGFFCASGLQANAYDPLEGVQPQPEAIVLAEHELGWVTVHKECDGESYAMLLRQLEQHGLPPPLIGEDLCDDQGRVVATVELSWPKAKVAVLYGNDSEEVRACAALGWACFVLGTVTARDLDAAHKTNAP